MNVIVAVGLEGSRILRDFRGTFVGFVARVISVAEPSWPMGRNFEPVGEKVVPNVVEESREGLPISLKPD